MVVQNKETDTILYSDYQILTTKRMTYAKIATNLSCITWKYQQTLKVMPFQGNKVEIIIRNYIIKDIKTFKYLDSLITNKSINNP